MTIYISYAEAELTEPIDSYNVRIDELTVTTEACFGTFWRSPVRKSPGGTLTLFVDSALTHEVVQTYVKWLRSVGLDVRMVYVNSLIYTEEPTFDFWYSSTPKPRDIVQIPDALCVQLAWGSIEGGRLFTALCFLRFLSKEYVKDTRNSIQEILTIPISTMENGELHFPMMWRLNRTSVHRVLAEKNVSFATAVYEYYDYAFKENIWKGMDLAQDPNTIQCSEVYSSNFLEFINSRFSECSIMSTTTENI